MAEDDCRAWKECARRLASDGYRSSEWYILLYIILSCESKVRLLIRHGTKNLKTAWGASTPSPAEDREEMAAEEFANGECLTPETRWTTDPRHKPDGLEIAMWEIIERIFRWIRRCPRPTPDNTTEADAAIV